MLIALLILTLLVSLALIYLGRRGRRIGTSPFCKKCHFDLRGKPTGVTRCSECGADLTLPGAILLGEHQRRRKLIIAGIVLLFVAALPLGFLTYLNVSGQDLYRFAPLWYLERQVEAPDSPSLYRASREILRRISAREISGPALTALIDRILDAQADLTKPFPPEYEGILGFAGTTAGFTPAQVERLYHNSYENVVELKPKLHQGGYINVEESTPGKRPLLLFQWSIDCSYSPLVIGFKEIHKPESFSGGSRNFGWNSIRESLPEDFPTGRQQLTYSCAYDVAIKYPSASPHAHFTQTFDRVVEVFAPEVVTDTLLTDLARAAAVRASFPEVTLDRQPPTGIVGGRRGQSDSLLIRIRIDRPAVNLCMDIFIGPNAFNENQIGRFFVPANDKNQWYVLRCGVPQELSADGGTNLCLKFSQELADDEMHRLDTYWGLPIEFKDIPIRPYDLSHIFNVDESPRSAIEKTLTCKLTRDPRGMAVKCQFQNPPLPLSYQVLLRHGGTLYRGNREGYSIIDASAGQHPFFGDTFPQPELSAGEKVDVILRPYLRSHPYSAASIPWGGEIILRDQILP